MANLRLKTDDTVIVTSGKDKGKTGRVLRVDRERGRVYVEGLNMIKRHQRPNPARPNAQVGVIEREGAIHISNVALADPKSGDPTRVGFKRTDQGTRLRVAKRSGSELD